MFTKVIFGRYVPIDSVIHRLDPRSKLVLSLYFIVLVFFANNWQSYAFLAATTLATILLTKVQLKFFWEGIRPLIFIIILTVLLQIVFSAGGTVYWHWGIFSITSMGLVNGVYVFMRFFLIICMSTVLTLTTPPLLIADAVESLMKPLLKIKVPVYEIALMLSIALRFIPTLMDETQKIMNAQRARGVNFSSGSLIKRVKSIVPILIPLFISAFNRAEDLATAMESRGYRGGNHRSKFRILKWRGADTIACVGMAAITAGLFLLRLL
ncbi:energy-coupling factor transporter transmembrane component T family protein [Paucilactobacillus nenjiangensis]|uniref:energy-coupling factor transporter transmembrane component T family protein n=1 Tax=Paucilactobacillus nenjiangensis TaxID=1296540 RepID=UPI0028D24884|nr:energy-coupling factor transporter transmembrane component T [Paucilactobacillus nenjiangensis]